MNNEAARVRVIRIGPLRIEGGPHVYVDDKEIDLSPLERRLLLELVRRRGSICHRQDLGSLRHPSATGEDEPCAAAAVHTRMKRLRMKLGHAGALLETVWGIGYRLTSQHLLRESGSGLD